MSHMCSLSLASVSSCLHSRMEGWVFFTSTTPLAPGSGHPCGSPVQVSSGNRRRRSDSVLAFCNPSVFQFSPLRQNCVNPVILAQVETWPWKSSLQAVGLHRRQEVVAEGTCPSWPRALLGWWFRRERAIYIFSTVSKEEN